MLDAINHSKTVVQGIKQKFTVSSLQDLDLAIVSTNRESTPQHKDGIAKMSTEQAKTQGGNGTKGIDSRSVLYSKGQNDECYTPGYAVTPILKYIPKDAVVWCPFDKFVSAFVQQIRVTNKAIWSHIDGGDDFYAYEPDEWDVMISNPPFTCKRQIFERALSFGKPFALLMSNTWLNDSAPAKIFKDKELQLLMFDKRIEFSGQKKITFSSSYYCWNFLPKQIIMETLEKY